MHKWLKMYFVQFQSPKDGEIGVRLRNTGEICDGLILPPVSCTLRERGLFFSAAKHSVFVGKSLEVYSFVPWRPEITDIVQMKLLVSSE